MVTQTQVLLADTQVQQPVLAEVFPVCEPLQIGVGLAEELTFHLLELTGTESEVARGDLVAECLTNLTNTEGQLAAGGALNVRKVYENALCGFGAQVAGAGEVLGYTDGSLEHQVELADGGEVMLAANGADHIFMLIDESIHLFKAHGIHVYFGMLFADQLVSAVTCLTALAVQQRIGKASHMAGGDPGLGIHDDSGIQADIQAVFLNELFQPCLLHVVLELNTQGAVVPAVGQAAVDLTACIHKAAILTQGHNAVEILFAVFIF